MNPSLAPGAACALEMTVADRNVRALEVHECLEGVESGTRLRFDLDVDAGRGVRLGDPVRFEWRPDLAGDTGGTLRLWVGALTLASRSGRPVLEVEAADPLSFASNERAFRSWSGGVPLLRLVSRVLEAQPGPLDGLSIAGSSPGVGPEWLLQADESGTAFLRRVCATHGRVLWWAREAFACEEMGGASGGDDPIQLASGERLFGIACRRAPDVTSAHVAWIEPDTRRPRRRPLAGRRLRSGAAEPAPVARVAAGLPVGAPRLATAAEGSRPGDRLLAWTADGRLAPGRWIETPDGDRFRVEAVEHGFPGAASYRNVVQAVRPERWGLAVGARERGMLGPFQAEVTHNDDPRRLGRIRVRLCDDPEARPTPWIPWLSGAADASAGMHWMPEVGSLVLLVAPLEAPESMVGIGALRGAGQPADAAWSSKRNGVKALVSNTGMALVFDDDRRELRLAVGETRIALSAAGVRVDGGEVRIAATSQAEFRAGAHVEIDAPRIDLGT